MRCVAITSLEPLDRRTALGHMEGLQLRLLLRRDKVKIKALFRTELRPRGRPRQSKALSSTTLHSA
jgi:hypothetical protein